MGKRVTWPVLKNFIDSKYLSLQWVEDSEAYYLYAIDGVFTVESSIYKMSPPSVEQAEFENTYKNSANQVLNKTDYTADNRMKVDAQISSTGIPLSSISKKFRIEFDETNFTSGSTYSSVYSYVGSGNFYGGTLDFNSDSSYVKLIVDSETVFELTLNQVEAIQSFTGSGCNDSGQLTNLNFITKTSGNRFNMDFREHPINFETSIDIQIKRTGSSNKTLQRKIIYISKEA